MHVQMINGWIMKPMHKVMDMEGFSFMLNVQCKTNIKTNFFISKHEHSTKLSSNI